jgi:serine carboxypeptidase-like clade II
MRSLLSVLALAAGALALRGAASRSPPTPQAAADLITNLPGFNASDWPTSWNQYSGYVTVDQTSDRRLFYWFQESQTDPDNQPLVLWQSGGPGCSSIGGGLLEEMGAFEPQKDGTLRRNPWTWNTVSNMLYVESPAFVGFSYSNNPGDEIVGDERTAQDLVQFLLGFFKRYPNYASRPLFLTAESYGGHYNPMLAKAIVDYNQGGNSPRINLQGMATGNAWTDAPIDNLGAAFDWWSHALVSDWCLSGIALTCNLTDVGPLDARRQAFPGSGGEYSAVLNMAKALRPGAASMGDCDYWQGRCGDEMSDKIDIYEIYADVCTTGSATIREADGLPTFRKHHKLSHSQVAMLKAAGRSRSLKKAGRSLQAAPVINTNTSNIPSGSAAFFEPCLDDYVSAYMNRHDVQDALHADTGYKMGRTWYSCSPTLQYSQQSLLSSMLPVYQDLVSQTGKDALHIIVYSGDVDAIVPVTGTRLWIDALGLPEKDGSNWRYWTSAGQQAGGFVVEYETGTPTNFSFVTVRNAGHLVPETQQSRALMLFQAFLAKTVPQ